MANELPMGTEFLANYGWALVIIPIVCVCMIPRQCDNEDEESVKWRWPTLTVLAFGALALAVPPMIGTWALIINFLPVRMGIIVHDPAAVKVAPQTEKSK